jgi:hypothetical protein
MTATQPAPPTLPEVSLRDLPETTKDFLLAHAATGKPLTEIIREILNAAANRKAA